MKPSLSVQQHREAMLRVILGHRVCNPRIFGSVAHGLDRDDSDLDLLVEPTAQTTLFDLARIQGELQRLLGVPVDVLTPNALPDKFRQQVLEDARPL